MNNAMIEQLAGNFAKRVRARGGERPRPTDRCDLPDRAVPPADHATRRNSVARQWRCWRTSGRSNSRRPGSHDRRRGRAEGTGDLLSRDHELGELPVRGLRCVMGLTLHTSRALPERARRHLRCRARVAPRRGRRSRRRRADRPQAAAAALPRQGQGRHSSVHERRPEPDGSVRPQADARQAPRQAVLRQDRRRGRVHRRAPAR